ncbi:hypothetical protein P4502_00395 [Peribacillus frigoritolerans]|nr:hypothetical protein [Peribacillus frigoritolerans]MED3707702.1 hypothetical protein [Peribacillus frigoritolerans]
MKYRRDGGPVIKTYPLNESDRDLIKLQVQKLETFTMKIGIMLALH